jgi:hypothetical protein
MEIGYVIRDARKYEVDPEELHRSLIQCTIEGCWIRPGGEAAFAFDDWKAKW